MKKFFKFCIACVLCLTSSLAIAKTETYTLDPMHSYVMFHINHFGFSNPSGKWMAQGTLTLDQDQPQNSSVNAIIQVNNIITGISELDTHLKSKLFFDTDKYPTATFVSNKIIMTGKKTAKIQGILTLHGISKPINLNVRLNKAGENPISNKMTVGFTGETELKRSDFGMTTLLPGLGDKVKIDIEIEANKVTG